MPELEELRYPFWSLGSFLTFAGNPAAFHLVVAWIVLLVLVVRLLSSKGASAALKALVLYFGLAMFTNAAFQPVRTVTLSDIAGVVCAYLGLRRILHRFAFPASQVGRAVCTAAVLMSVHAVIVGALYADLNDTDLWNGNVALVRFGLLAKVFVFGLAAFLFTDALRTGENIVWFLRWVATFAMLGLCIYVLQACMLLAGVIPYGLFFDAAYIGFPAFGAVSIERGHFGKLMTPLFPLFLLLALRNRQKKGLVLFCIVTLVNFSASSLSYFAVYLFLTAMAFWRRIFSPRVVAVGLGVAVLVASFVAYTSRLWVGLVGKIILLGLEGDAEGGRGSGLVWIYLQRFPLGITYSASSLRSPPGQPELNAGMYAFLSQESLLAVPLLMGFAVLLWAGWRSAGRQQDADLRRILRVGILLMPVIFSVDILWFVPTIWLPLMLAFAVPGAAPLVWPRARPELLPGDLPAVLPPLASPGMPVHG